MEPTSNSFYNLDAERYLIGIAINYPDKVKALTAMRRDEFYGEQNRILHQCICELEKEKRSIDFITIDDWLKKNTAITVCWNTETVPSFRERARISCSAMRSLLQRKC